jgi:hypothetical protein
MVEAEGKIMSSLLVFGTYISNTLPKTISTINPNIEKIMR